LCRIAVLYSVVSCFITVCPHKLCRFFNNRVNLQRRVVFDSTCARGRRYTRSMASPLFNVSYRHHAKHKHKHSGPYASTCSSCLDLEKEWRRAGRHVDRINTQDVRGERRGGKGRC
jgi:hypothetical protein